MGPASSRIHFPEDKLGTKEQEITDQQHTPLFGTHKTNDVKVNESTALNITCHVINTTGIQKCTSVAVVTFLLGCRFW